MRPRSARGTARQEFSTATTVAVITGITAEPPLLTAPDEHLAANRVSPMISQQGVARNEFVIADGLSQADVQHVHREALRVLRCDIDSADLDAYSDEAWPPAVLNSYERALSLAREEVTAGTRSRRNDLGMGIGIDVRDDEQFGVLLDLAPYTINADGRQGDCLIFSANDTGTSLCIAVTQEQETELLSRLAARGISSTVLVPLPPRRRRWNFLRLRTSGAT
ncbi:hypothetical protein OHB54_43820 [Streptomyces sp. NBC_01007]|nr:hypothetical protein OHB54_43820 [Streptomyces sp. NBC_01007]